MENPKYSFRVTPDIGARIDDQAAARGMTASDVVREIVTAHFASQDAAGPNRVERRPAGAAEAVAERRFQQLIYEIAKTRSALLHFASHSLPAETVDAFTAAAERDGKEYAGAVIAAMSAAELEEGDAAGR